MTPPPPPSPLGTLGRYRLVARLAQGGMAEVFLAVLPGPAGFEKPVVLKRMRPELAGQADAREMFAQEARLMGAFGHGNVLAVLDYGEEGEVPFLVLEYVEGVDLARALEHVHSLRDGRGELLGLVHRDVSPANVLLGRSGDVKLGDFGIAKGLRTPARTAPGATRGKLRYMSPEQLRGGPLDARADLFSLGVLLWEAVVGHSPFAATTDAQLLLAVRDARLVPLEVLVRAAGGGLADVIARALRPHPSERYASAAELARALLAVQLPGEAEQPWRVAELVASTLAAEGRAPPGEAGPAPRSPFSAVLLEGQGDEEP